MKRKWNILLSALLAGVLSASVLSGCGTDGQPPSPGKDSPAQGKNTAELSFWYPGSQEPDVSLWESAIEHFNSTTKTSYKITGVPNQADAYKQKIVVAMSSGKCPQIYTHWTGGPMNEYIDAGFAQPITQLMTESGVKDRLLEGGLAQCYYKDELYAVPVLNCSVAGIFYNREQYEENGLTVPETLSELEKNCDVLKQKGIIPFALGNVNQWTGSMYYMYFATRMGGLEPFSQAVDGSGTFESDNFIYAGQKIQDWVDKGYFPQGVNGLDEGAGQQKQMLYTGEACMELMGSWMVGSYKTDSEAFYEKVGWFPFPAIDGSDADSSILIGTIGDNFVSFNCKDDMLKAAFDCVSYYSTEESTANFVKAGKLPPVKGVTTEEPIQQQIAKAIEEATAVQLWYDQYLPPEVGEVHKSESQKLFDHTATPEEVAKAQQEAMQAYLAEKK